MRKSFVFKTASLLFMVILLSCGTVQVYEEPDKPVFVSNEVNNTSSSASDSLTVLSYNIAKAEKIQEAISELQTFEKTTPVDVYMLQEMDDAGVQAIAKELGLNYLYIPVVYNKLLKKNIGNAILARGIISDPKKLILPHKKWVNGRRRHVTVGEVTIRNKKILVYSVHTETSTMGRKKRLEQWDTIIEHARSQSSGYQYMVIGGDFNTLFPKDAKEIVQKFSLEGFAWATTGIGYTAEALFGLIKPKEDYIFSKGLQAINAGKLEGSKASDHYPLF